MTKNIRILLAILCLSTSASYASESRADLDTWYALIKIGCPDRLENFHLSGNGQPENFVALIDKALKSMRPESLATLVTFYHDFSFQEKPELSAFLTQSRVFRKQNVLRLVLERAKSALRLQGEDLRFVVDTLKATVDQINEQYLRSNQPALPRTCTLLASLILKREIPDNLVELAFRKSSQPYFCSVEGKPVLTAELLNSAGRLDLFRKIVGGSIESYAERRFLEIVESENPADQAEVEFWISSGYVKLF
jgi:hypothetical protein